MSGFKALKFTVKVTVNCEWEDGRPDPDSLRELILEQLDDLMIQTVDGQSIDVEVLSAREDADDVWISAIIDIQGTK